jgi:succinyl-CoA synthetase beta subunit
MKVHEYQAKAILKRYGVPVPRGGVASSGVEAKALTGELGGKAVLKAQVHAGGRGKAGGVAPVGSPEEAGGAASSLLGKQLVTAQTGPEGVPVRKLLVEETAQVSGELYLAITVDRVVRGPVVIASDAGGMEIEEVAAREPERVHREAVDPLLGFQPFQGRRLAKAVGLDTALARPLSQIMGAIYRVFVEKDCSLVEINPLAITGDGRLVALDAKLELEDDSLFRHEDLTDLRDPEQENPFEARAREYGIAYVKLDGEVGCLVNGAGLAMATLDLAKSVGAAPANFLDVGGGATEEKVASAVKLIISDPKVTRVLINLFGGILRCEVAARGVVQAFEETGSRMPLIVRLLGTNMEEGLSIFQESGLPVTFAETLADVSEAVRPAR